MNSLVELLEEELKDLYNAEHQLLKALPRMAKKASSPTLKKAFTAHTTETERQIKRLDQIGKRLGVKLSGKTCQAMKGLVEEGKEIMGEDGETTILDAALIGAAQRVEHYEIAAYGTARAIAEQLGDQQVAKLLQQSLDEESATDEKLTKISVGELLPAAPMEEQENEDE